MLLLFVIAFAIVWVMKLDKYISLSGTPAVDLAKTLGIPPSMLYQWRKEIRSVPPAKCYAIERATNGKVTRKDLRPDDWQEIWPELKEAEHA